MTPLRQCMEQDMVLRGPDFIYHACRTTDKILFVGRQRSQRLARAAEVMWMFGVRWSKGERQGIMAAKRMRTSHRPARWGSLNRRYGFTRHEQV